MEYARACKLFSVPLSEAFDESTSDRERFSGSEKYACAIDGYDTHQHQHQPKGAPNAKHSPTPAQTPPTGTAAPAASRAQTTRRSRPRVSTPAGA